VAISMATAREENGEFSVTVVPVTMTAGILLRVLAVEGASFLTAWVMCWLSCV